MRKKNMATISLRVKSYPWLITLILLTCSIIYYLPVFAGLAGWTFRDTLTKIHDLYGIDFYGIMFFVPVVYTAYVRGISLALVIAFVSTLISDFPETNPISIAYLAKQRRPLPQASASEPSGLNIRIRRSALAEV